MGTREHVIDLRSDTVTVPTEEMRDAMRAAPVGDDVYGEDPTVNRFETLAADRLGKEAGLFVPSGSMGNLVSLLAQTRPGQEIVLEEHSHIYNFEAGAVTRIAGLQVRPVRAERGIMTPAAVRQALKQESLHTPGTGVIAIESTHNRAGGSVYPMDRIAEIAAIAGEARVPLHLDGARVFNAAIALGVSVASYVAPAGSVTFCVSKGLGAPVGSVVVGRQAFIDRARGFRKMLGGGMRQAGIIAAAGIVALEKMIDRLRDDHVHARRLAEGLAELPGVEIDPALVETNIVIFTLSHPRMDATAFWDRLWGQGIRVHQISPTQIRCLTHKDVGSEDIEAALKVMRQLLG